MDLSLERIEEAAHVVDPPLLNTPQFSDPILSGALGREVVVKLENVSPIGSFKGRGADYFVAGLERRDQRLVSATAGNWGIGLAYAGRRHGRGVDIFAGAAARPGKLGRMRAFGANVTSIEGGPDEVHAAARELAGNDSRYRLVADGEPAAVAEGHGTIGIELLRAGHARHGRRPDRRRRADRRNRALAQSAVAGDARGRRVRERRTRDEAEHRRRAARRSEPTTIAGGLAISEPIAASLERVRTLVDDVVLVDDDDMLTAMALIADTIGVLVEPSGAAGVAAVQRHSVPGERIAVDPHRRLGPARLGRSGPVTLEDVVASGLPGAVVVAHTPDRQFEAAAGFANLATREPLTVDHRFRIGSVTKIFVATLVLQLVADGLLELDGDAAPFAEGITVRAAAEPYERARRLRRRRARVLRAVPRDPARRWELTLEDELRLVQEKPRLFAPGEGWAYHGSNYIVLGLLVERATGTPLREALQERLFAPLGLTRTELVDGPLRGDCARGYLPPDNPILPGGPEPVDVTEIDVPFHRAGGGIVSTAGEIATTLRRLLGGELLPAELRAEMLDAVESDWEETDRYGLGIGELTSLMRKQRSPCGSAWGHIGFSVGYTAFALSSEDGERQVVLCANGNHATQADEEEFWDAAGTLAWDLYCS